MTALNQNPPQPLAAGDSFALSFPIEIVGDVIDLAGATCQWGLYINNRDGEQKLLKTSAPGVTLTQVAGVWTFKVNIAPGETAEFAGDYYHEATVSGAGFRYTIASGMLTFRGTRNP